MRILNLTPFKCLKKHKAQGFVDFEEKDFNLLSKILLKGEYDIQEKYEELSNTVIEVVSKYSIITKNIMMNCKSKSLQKILHSRLVHIGFKIL